MPISPALKKELDAHANQAYNEGISEGLNAGFQILNMFRNNVQLKFPHDLETLSNWSKDVLLKLKEMKKPE